MCPRTPNSLVLRHENTVLRRQITEVRYEPADRFWFAALSSPIPRRRWAEILPVSPATLLTWHRRPVARKWDYTARRKPGQPSTMRGHPPARSIYGTVIRQLHQTALPYPLCQYALSSRVCEKAVQLQQNSCPRGLTSLPSLRLAAAAGLGILGGGDSSTTSSWGLLPSSRRHGRRYDLG